MAMGGNRRSQRHSRRCSCSGHRGGRRHPRRRCVWKRRSAPLKILPDAFASDPNRLARFTREAQTLASLNHPDIAAIYGIEESKEVRALVLVEGPTLADRIAQSPIPIRPHEGAGEVASLIEKACPSTLHA